MNLLGNIFRSSLAKKYTMALSGLILVGFVLGHMLGNLQIFGAPDAINAYAYFLHNVLPWEVLWLVRIVLLAAVVLHILTAILLVIENRKARPEGYDRQQYMRTSFAARTMKYSGLVLLAFIVFHILHFTVQNIDPAYQNLRFDLDGKNTQDVYAMVVYGFSNVWIAGFYIVSMALLCWHLTHGVASMFQSLGLRNEIWRGRLSKFAVTYGWVIFLGFAALPAASMISWYGGPDIVQATPIREAVENWDGESPLYVDYATSTDLAKF